MFRGPPDSGEHWRKTAKAKTAACRESRQPSRAIVPPEIQTGTGSLRSRLKLDFDDFLGCLRRRLPLRFGNCNQRCLYEQRAATQFFSVNYVTLGCDRDKQADGTAHVHFSGYRRIDGLSLNDNLA